MILTLQRLDSLTTSTLGALYVGPDLFGFSLEDVRRNKKVYGKTRISAGRYEITLAPWGRLHEKYMKKFPTFHKGMLMLNNVPDFSGILIHMGNFSTDTDGCILVGMLLDCLQEAVFNSEAAYVKLYKTVVSELTKGTKVFIEIKNEILKEV